MMPTSEKSLKDVTLCGLNEEQVQKLKQSYESLYELVFMGGNKLCAASDKFTSRMRCCDKCGIWYDIDDTDDDGKALIMCEEEGNDVCRDCYSEFCYSVEEHTEDGFTTEDFVAEEDAQVYFDNLGKVRKDLLKVYKDNSENDETIDSYDPDDDKDGDDVIYLKVSVSNGEETETRYRCISKDKDSHEFTVYMDGDWDYEDWCNIQLDYGGKDMEGDVDEITEDEYWAGVIN